MKLIFFFIISLCLILLWAKKSRINVTDLFPSSSFEIEGGYIPVERNSSGEIFYMGFSSLEKTSEEILLFWFQGGPGCSSSLANFFEVGPFRLQNNGSFSINPFSWGFQWNIVFVDQPIGVGLSESGNSTIPKNSDEAAIQMANFFEGYFKTHPEMKDKKLYLVGESYAGHFIPAIATKLSELNYKIEGIAIGDGWTSPINQFSLANFAFSAGLISSKRRKIYEEMENQAVIDYYNGNLHAASDLFSQETGENATSYDITNITGVDRYDYRQYSAEPVNESLVSSFFLEAKVKERLQIPKDFDYKTCNSDFRQPFAIDFYTSKAEDIAKMLQKTKVLLYSGQNDLEVNAQGSYTWISQLDWPGLENFSKTSKKPFIVKGELKGFIKSSTNLTYAYINNAGHLVPLNQPEASLELMKNWIQE